MNASPSFFAYVGSRTTRERNGRGNGLNVYRVDCSTGEWVHLQLLSDLVNPSFLAFDRTRRFLYTVHGDGREITAFSIGGDGRLTFICRQQTGGLNPVHLAVSPDNRFIVVANHISSNLALLPRNQDGSLDEPVDIVLLDGPLGPHRLEQPFAKPHQVEFDPKGHFILVPDKGLDRIFTCRIDADARKLVLLGDPAIAREGAGPRHITFHPTGRFAYVVNELDSTVTAYEYDQDYGRLTPFQVRSSLPDSFTGNSRASEIALSADSRRLLVSNRGSDTLAILQLDDGGRLDMGAWSRTLGRTPRFFGLDPSGCHILVANEDSDTIVTFSESEAGLGPMDTPSVAVGSPVCIVTLQALRSTP